MFMWCWLHNEARYPKFVKWIEDKIADGITIRGSVEFVGTKENDGEIIYDGGWKEQGRIPMIYDYSGYCILSVKRFRFDCRIS